jgi:hypothetical protein
MKDYLPSGTPDPLLLSILDLNDLINQFKKEGLSDVVTFLNGVKFARVSLRAAGITRA